MNNRIIIKLMILSFLAVQLIFPQVFALDKKVKDELILSQVFQKKFSDADGGFAANNGFFTIIEPNNKLYYNIRWLYSGKERLKDTLASINTDIDGADIDLLFSALVKRNRKSKKLPLKSSPENGYIVDYDRKFEKYFIDEGVGGWEKLYRENPKARGMVEISLPAYNEKSNLVLVYVGIQFYELFGHGWLILYRFNDGELRELIRQGVWVS